MTNHSPNRVPLIFPNCTNRYIPFRFPPHTRQSRPSPTTHPPHIRSLEVQAYFTLRTYRRRQMILYRLQRQRPK
ncbi:hypothetical protein QL285_070924 [Trifolium repens]|nr:hypothetical protein QL285_070924 [Trifolium repens]